MNSTQNQKITQITSTTLIVGVDIAKFKHVARAQDFRGVEYGKPIAFENSLEGFECFVSWFRKIMSEHGYKYVLVGMEPTGHYWLNLVHYLKEHQISCGVVLFEFTFKGLMPLYRHMYKIRILCSCMRDIPVQCRIVSSSSSVLHNIRIHLYMSLLHETVIF
jgi:hypothetical protein